MYKTSKLIEFDDFSEQDGLDNDDDLGFEIDDSGMIPKIEELKAIKIENEPKDNDMDIKARKISGKDLFGDDIQDIDDTQDLNNIQDIQTFDDNKIIADFETIDEVDDDKDIAENIKINYYDEYENSEIAVSLNRIADSLERIADSLEKMI